MKLSTKNILVQLITASRIPLGLVIFLILSGDDKAKINLILVGVLMTILELTDILDGFVARRFGIVSTFGKYFDPFCDSVARLLVYLGLLEIHLVPMWLIIIIITRDIVLSFLYLLYYAETKQYYESRMSAKIKAWIQGSGAIMLVIYAIIISSTAAHIGFIRPIIIWVIATVTILSLVDYSILVFSKSAVKPQGNSK